MFRNEGRWEDFVQKIKTRHNKAEPLMHVSDAAAQLASDLGFREFHVYLTIDGRKVDATKIQDMDPVVHETIAEILSGITPDETNDEASCSLM